MNDSIILSEDGKTLIKLKDSSIKSFFIPNGIRKIKDGALSGCYSLKTITISESVSEIDNNAYNWDIQQINVVPNNQFFSSEDGVLYNKDKSVLIRFPLSKPCINYNIPENVKIIGEKAFRSCHSIESINIPKSIVTIKDDSFILCSSLLSIHVDKENNYYSSENGVLYNKEKTILLKSPDGKSNISYCPDSLTQVDKKAFRNCKIKSIILPKSITEIEEESFSNCFLLESIDIPNSVTKIGRKAFSGCFSLKSVDIASSVIEIGDLAFVGCSSLKSIYIPKSVNKIGYGVFDCGELEQIIVDKQNNYFSSESGVLYNKCKSLLIKYPEKKNCKSYHIPDSVTKIEKYAFNNSLNIESIHIPNTVIEIGEGAFIGCQHLKCINLPNVMKVISTRMFEGCMFLNNIIIPESVIRIESMAFNDCYIDSLIIPNSVLEIEDHAFANMNSLKSINIPNSVERIGKEIFINSFFLKSINSQISNLDNVEINDEAFYGIEVDNNWEIECVLSVPPGTRWEYRNHNAFCIFKNIEIEERQ